MPGGTISIPTTAIMLLAASGMQCALAAIVWDLHDIVAATGAFLASAIALLEAKDKGRPLRYQISVLLASIVVGTTTPGAVVGFYWPERFTTLTWHIWALAGFATGLGGWSVVYGCLKVFQRRIPSVIDNAAKRFAPNLETPDPDDTKKLEQSREFRRDQARRNRYRNDA